MSLLTHSTSKGQGRVLYQQSHMLRVNAGVHSLAVDLDACVTRNGVLDLPALGKMIEQYLSYSRGRLPTMGAGVIAHTATEVIGLADIDFHSGLGWYSESIYAGSNRNLRNHELSELRQRDLS